jgi:maltose O-acetyltransferase
MVLLFNKLYYAFLALKKRRYIKLLMNRGLNVGKNVWFVDTFFLDPSHCYLISIGDNSTICPNVRMIAHDASTKKLLGYTKFGKIDIRENSFIGDSTVILPNVTIGPNSIVGAGSVVTKSIPANTVAAGNPAKPICSLEEYLVKIKRRVSDGKKIFSKDYGIDILNSKQRQELIDDAQDSMGFII